MRNLYSSPPTLSPEALEGRGLTKPSPMIIITWPRNAEPYLERPACQGPAWHESSVLLHSSLQKSYVSCRFTDWVAASSLPPRERVR